jgi:hypothetical protein
MNRVRGAESLTEPLAVGALGASALLLLDPPDTGIPWCPSAILFGVACPLCGLTRGVARLVRGDVGASLGFHPLAWLVLAVAVAAWVAWLGRRAGWWSGGTAWFSRRTVPGLFVALAVTWLVRGVAGTLPPI